MSDVLNRALYQYSRLTAAEQKRLVAEVIDSGRLSSLDGPYVRELERKVAERLGRREAIATGTATAAFELALRALDIGPGHEVVIPEFGWISVGAAVAATGATVRVAPITTDLAPTWPQIEPLIGPATKAVIVAHMRGTFAPDLPRIAAELDRAGITLIEDCAQAWGVREAGTHGRTAVFSIQRWKLIATGEGGLAATDDVELARTMRAMSGNTRVHIDGQRWRGNVRMPEITAALALPQLAHLDQLTERLRTLQQRIAAAVTGFDVHAPVNGNGNGSIVGLWGDGARPLADRLFRTGIGCWHPGEGDLHLAAGWPTPAAEPAVDLSRYVSVLVPYLPMEDHDEFTALIADEVAEAVR